MGDDDIEVTAFAEKNADANDWKLVVHFEGNCLLGCGSRKMLRTRNLAKAMDWVDDHTVSPEHVARLLRHRAGHGVIKTPGFDGPEGTEWPGGKAKSS